MVIAKVNLKSYNKLKATHLAAIVVTVSSEYVCASFGIRLISWTSYLLVVEHDEGGGS